MWCGRSGIWTGWRMDDKTRRYLTDFWREEMRRQMIEPLWFYRVNPKPPMPWWHEVMNRARWNTIGRFRAWLHRDCDRY